MTTDPNSAELEEHAAAMCDVAPRILALSNRHFQAGYLIAVANIMNLHGEDTIAADVLGELGFNPRDLKKFDFSEYDLRALKPLIRRLGPPVLTEGPQP